MLVCYRIRFAPYGSEWPCVCGGQQRASGDQPSRFNDQRIGGEREDGTKTIGLTVYVVYVCHVYAYTR
jgi:hypothetical protein